MKASAIFIVLVAVAAVVSGQTATTTTGSMATSDNAYRFSWTILNGRLTGVIVVTGTAADTWAAVGFSDNNMMPMTDAILGGSDGAGASFVEDRWINNDTPRTPANLVYDSSQDITITSAVRVAGVLTITFTRPLSATDMTNDVSIANKCVYVLWAYGGTVGNFSSTPVTGLTGHTAMGVFPQQLCGCTSIVMSLGVLLLGALIATFATY